VSHSIDQKYRKESENEIIEDVKISKNINWNAGVERMIK